MPLRSRKRRETTSANKKTLLKGWRFARRGSWKLPPRDHRWSAISTFLRKQKSLWFAINGPHHTHLPIQWVSLVEVQDIPAWEKEQLYEACKAKESFWIVYEAGSTWHSGDMMTVPSLRQQPSEFQREQPISLQLDGGKVAPDKLTLISCTQSLPPYSRSLWGGSPCPQIWAAKDCQCTTPLCSLQANLQFWGRMLAWQ